MPDLKITVTTAQATRARKAFSFLNEDGTNASDAQIQTWILRQVRAKVLQAELGDAGGAAEATQRAVLEAEGW